MPAVQPTGTEPDTQRPDPQASPQAVAERALRSGPYPALEELPRPSERQARSSPFTGTLITLHKNLGLP